MEMHGIEESDSTMCIDRDYLAPIAFPCWLIKID